VKAILALHCSRFQHEFMEKFILRMRIGKIAQMWWRNRNKGADSLYPAQIPLVNICNNSSEDIKIRSTLSPLEAKNEDIYRMSSFFFAYELRRHFGEQVALYFTYILYYSKWLLVPGFAGILVSFIGNISPGVNGRLLAVWGLMIAGIWAPLFLVYWRRKNKEMNLMWNVTDVTEAGYINKFFDPKRIGLCGKQKHVYEHLEDVPPMTVCQRLPAYCLLALFAIVMVILMLGVTGAMVHVYMKLKTEGGFTGLELWLLILVQGIVLGLIVDIMLWEFLKYEARVFTNLENYKWESEFDKSFITKVFMFEWLAMYFWFFSLSLGKVVKRQFRGGLVI